jgi:hypothetical protein
MESARDHRTTFSSHVLCFQLYSLVAYMHSSKIVPYRRPADAPHLHCDDSTNLPKRASTLSLMIKYR